jgi:DNA repair exonuclease SbcCD nuclease subunit
MEVVTMGERTVNDDQASAISDATNIQKDSNDAVITVVLTADNHLGSSGFGQHPRKREERQKRLRDAFQQATDFAVVQGVDLFIQAGDLFDTTAPDERDRSFVASRLAQLKQANIQTFAIGGMHDTQPVGDDTTPAPQISYARLGALHYFPPLQRVSEGKQELESVTLNIHGIPVAICGLSVVAGQEGDPLAYFSVPLEVERAALSILLLHAPIEDLATGSSLLENRTLVSRSSIQAQSFFSYILAGYHHQFYHSRIGHTELVVAGATQQVDSSNWAGPIGPNHEPGFVFLGLAADGIRWCNHISVDTLSLLRLVLHTSDLWSEELSLSPTDVILERLRPLCNENTMIQIHLEGELKRSAYHQLDLNQIRRYGEEHCFALAIDDSALSLLSEQETFSPEMGERLSPREELITLADEWISATSDEQERAALRMTREEVIKAMDELKSRR